jgi:hypothetical protein
MKNEELKNYIDAYDRGEILYLLKESEGFEISERGFRTGYSSGWDMSYFTPLPSGTVITITV